MISIIIPTHNEQDYIGSLLSCISENAGADVEVIVVDGGSEDHTTTIVKEFVGVKLIHSEKGRAIQMNCGAQIGKGDVLFFIHADSQLPNLWQEKILILSGSAISIQGNRFTNGVQMKTPSW